MADAALILTDVFRDLDCANGKIVATDKILTDVEIKAQLSK